MFGLYLFICYTLKVILKNFVTLYFQNIFYHYCKAYTQYYKVRNSFIKQQKSSRLEIIPKLSTLTAPNLLLWLDKNFKKYATIFLLLLVAISSIHRFSMFYTNSYLRGAKSDRTPNEFLLRKTPWIPNWASFILRWNHQFAPSMGKTLGELKAVDKNKPQ